MGSQPQATLEPRGKRRVLVLLVIVGLVILAAVAGGWAYFWFSGHNLTGLEGTWRDTNNPNHGYEFRPNGAVDTWSGSKQWWNRIGWVATWRRDGNRITIRTDRNWDFEGQLDGNVIRGKMLMRGETGGVYNTADEVWQKE